MFALSIKTDNSAFEGENCDAEIARILREVARQVESTPKLRGMAIRDIDGNPVGGWGFVEVEE